MIIGTGLDLMDVARIRKALEKKHFRERVFTTGENAHIDAKGAESAAGIYAAKEAIAKALGTGFRNFGPWDIEIVWNELGAPACILKNGALARKEALGGGRIHLSISHLSDTAAAMAILTDEPEPNIEQKEG